MTKSQPFSFPTLKEAQAAAKVAVEQGHPARLPKITAPGLAHWGALFKPAQWIDLVSEGRSSMQLMDVLKSGHVFQKLGHEERLLALRVWSAKGRTGAVGWALSELAWQKCLTVNSWAALVVVAARSRAPTSSSNLTSLLSWGTAQYRKKHPQEIQKTLDCALHACVERAFGNDGIDPLKILLKRGANPEVVQKPRPPREGESPLRSVVIQQVMNKKKDWMSDYSYGRQAIHALLAAGASLDKVGLEGESGWQVGERAFEEEGRSRVLRPWLKESCEWWAELKRDALAKILDDEGLPVAHKAPLRARM